MVGVYDATDGFTRIGEFPTFGVGPHELLLLGDGDTIAVANGGIETHPDFGRAKLNLADHEAVSRAWSTARPATLLEKHELPPERCTSFDPPHGHRRAGAVWFGCQHEGPATERPCAGRPRRAQQGTGD